MYPSLKYRTDIEEGIGLSLNADAHTGSTGEEEKRAGNIRMLQQLALSQLNMEQLAFHRLFFYTESVKLHDLSTSLMAFIEISEYLGNS